jgi:hypothetical protein
MPLQLLWFVAQLVLTVLYGCEMCCVCAGRVVAKGLREFAGHSEMCFGVYQQGFGLWVAL